MDTVKKEIEYKEVYSNLFYNLSGIVGYILFDNLLFCLALQALGSASFVYHYHKTKPIQLFDWWAMMFVISILTGIIVPYDWIWIYVIGWQIVYTILLLGKFRVYLEVGMSIVPCLLAIFIYKSLPSFLIILALFLASAYIRSFDADIKQERFHDSWGHSIWHLLTAFGFLLVIWLK